MKVLLTGGGTMGSVTPLLAIVEEFKKTDSSVQFFFLGTKTGPERKVVAEYGWPFFAVSGGKWRRYFSFKNLLDPFLVIAGFFQSFSLIRKIRPDAVVTAGAFISVPVVFAAACWRVPVLVHQEDIIPGLANKLMAGRARKITVTFEDSLKYYPKNKTSWIGNPVRASVLTGNIVEARKKFNLEPNLPTLLAVGGGTGALSLNQAVVEGLESLCNFCQVIHVTGNRIADTGYRIPKRYHHYEFLTAEMKDALAAADIVVSRAGMGFLTELAALGKAVVLVPLPGHQEANAAYFAKNNAALLLNQQDLNAENLAAIVKNLLDNQSDKANLERNIKTMMKPGAEGEMVKIILELTKNR